ncbi:MAG TPA: hypothetical protein VFY71_05705 [Planctomycetota bacterium]|nr:hypothetical protein [Planctomycetota bacterium]
MGRIGEVMACLALMAPAAAAQMVNQWLPARVELHSVLAADVPQLRVIEGLPGELMTVRVVPKVPGPAVGWAVDLLQDDDPTKTFLGGPGGVIELDPVPFGSGGAVALRLRSLDGSSGKYVLRAHSKLPAGWSHPWVGFVGDPEIGFYQTAAALRPGLTLRLRASLPHKAQGWPQASVPELLVTPPALVDSPYASGFSLPGTVSGKPYPDLVKLDASFEFSQVQLEVGAGGLSSVHVRVHSHKTVLGKVKKPSGPAAGANPGGGDLNPPTFASLQLDADEALPGESVHLAAVVHPKATTCPEPTATVRVWLSSIHPIDWDGFGGWLLAGPVEVSVPPTSFGFEADLQVPADVPPGLYGVWLVLDEPGGPIFGCDNIYHGGRAATVLKVRAP